MVIREFLTRLAFDADQSKVERFDRAIGKLKVGLLAIVGAATAASGVAMKLAGDTARYGDELAKTAARLGINTDALESLRFAAERSGVATSTMEMALQRMTRRLSEAANGSGEAKNAIAELGLDAQALGNMAPEKAMNVLADALAGVENQSDRVRLAFKFFDSEGVALLNMLEDGSAGLREMDAEFRRLSGGLTGDQAKAAEAYDDAMTNLRTTLDGLRLQIGAKLMPVMQPLIEAFTEFLVINRELILARVQRAFEILIGVMRSLMRMVSRAWSAIDTLAQSMGGWERIIRMVSSVLAVLVAVRVAKWAWAIHAGIKALMGVLSWRMLMRWGIWGAAILFAALALEDIYHWINDNESAIGDLLGPFDEFVESLGDVERLANMVIGIALAAWAWRVGGAMITAGLGVGFLNTALNSLWRHPLLRLLGVGSLLAVNPEVGQVDAGKRPGALDQALGAEDGETVGAMLNRKIRGLFGLGDEPDAGEPDTGLPGAPSSPMLPERSLPSRDELERFLNQSSVPAGPTMPGASEVNNTANTVQMDTQINVTVPAGSTREQAQYIASTVRQYFEREVNRAGTALET